MSSQEPASPDSPSSTRPAIAPKLRTVTLAAALYFIVCGGPFGLEELAQKVGFELTLVILVVTPLMWSVPVALLTTELATSIPEDGGFYIWVKRGLGPFWGFQEAWLSLAASIFDMGIYPALFTAYLARLVPAAALHPVMIGALFIGASASLNLRGANVVGLSSAALSVLLVLPFVGLGVLCILHPLTTTPALPTAPQSRDVLGGVLIALWNYMGWDNIGSVGGEVREPQRTFPKAIFMTMIIAVLTYTWPIATANFAHVDPSAWESGSFAELAGSFGGVPMQRAMAIAGLVSAFGMFTTLTLAYSRVLMRLAHDKWVPPALGKRSATGSPVGAILVLCIIWMASLGLSFEKLVTLDIMLYGLSLLLEFAALVALRIREPALIRPFRIPGGVTGILLLAVAPTILVGFSLFRNRTEVVFGMPALLFGALVVATGPLVYHASKRLRRARGIVS